MFLHNGHVKHQALATIPSEFIRETITRQDYYDARSRVNYETWLKRKCQTEGKRYLPQIRKIEELNKKQMKPISPICSRPSTTTGSTRKSKWPEVPSSYSPCKTTRFYEVEKEENINPIPMINEGDHLPPAAAWMIPRRTPVISKQYIYEPFNYKINNHLVRNNKTKNMNQTQTDYRKKLYESEYDDEEDERMILKMRKEEIENEMKLLNNQIEELKTKEKNRSSQRLFTETHRRPERRSPYINTMF